MNNISEQLYQLEKLNPKSIEDLFEGAEYFFIHGNKLKSGVLFKQKDFHGRLWYFKTRNNAHIQPALNDILTSNIEAFNVKITKTLP